jgi:hypothetical protein
MDPKEKDFGAARVSEMQVGLLECAAAQASGKKAGAEIVTGFHKCATCRPNPIIAVLFAFTWLVAQLHDRR